MSQDTAPRYRYAVTFSVTLYVEAETESNAANYAEEQLNDFFNATRGPAVFYRHEETAREDA